MGLVSDLLQSARLLRRERRYALVAVATTAIGIASATTMITVVRQVLLAPLSYPHANQLAIVETAVEKRKPFPRTTGGDLVDIRRDLTTADAVAYYFGGEVGVQFGSRAAFAFVEWTTSSFFRVFSTVPEAGRLLGDGAVDEAVVSDAFASQTFGAPGAALGRRLSVDHRVYTIVGVAARGFRFPSQADMWVSTPEVPENLNRTSYNYRMVARVRAGVPFAAAARELTVVGARLAQAYPENRDKALVLVPLRDYLVGDVRPTLYLLLAAVIVLLIIACANVANLQLARGISRGRDLAVRAALGADAASLVRTTIAESVAVGLAGAIAGAAITIAAVTTVARWAPADLPRTGDVHVDWRILATAAGLALATGIISGLAPARHAARLDVAGVMREEGERTAGGRHASRLRQLLVGGEIALAFVLALTAVLLVRSLDALERVELGFDPDNILVMYAHEPALTGPEYDRALDRLDDLLGRARGLPGVRSAGAVMGLPAGRYGSNGSYAVEGRQRFVPGRPMPQAEFSLASPGYFGAMGIRLQRGRDFTASDRGHAVPVVIVSESVAREQFGAGDAIGHRIMCGLDLPLQWMTVVGVVGDVRHSPGAPPSPELYMPLAQHKFRANEVEIVVRGHVPATSLADPMRSVAASIDPDMATSVTTLDSMLRESIATPRLRMTLVTLFGTIALLLAITGVYGVVSYSVLQRTREFAVRSALGATPADVVRHVVAGAWRVSVAALGAGALVAALASRTLNAVLFGVSPLDAVAYVATAAIVLITSLGAALVPAWRASAVDPAEALKAE